MIVFDLHCGARHGFEAWFASSGAYEAQRAGGLIACPYCGDTKVEKAVMAPRIAGTGDTGPPPDLLPKLAALQAKMLEGSQWVGGEFATKARAMDAGEVEKATIHGTATREEAKALRDEGVGVMPLLFPVAPPEALN